MLLGIDVGGTHTDAVVVGRQGIVAAAKTVTRHDDLLSSVRAALQQVLPAAEAGKIRQVNLSTTLTTNAIVEDRLEKTGVFVVAGPGVDPNGCRTGDHYFTCRGSIDHRGKVRQPLDREEIASWGQQCRENGLRTYAVVGKFSPRNPEHELELHDLLRGQADFIAVGHQLGGRLNFPRRVATSYYNAAVWRAYNRFADAVSDSVREFGLEAAIDILKADGGTMPLALSRRQPVQSILSGPAASVMGIIALCDISDDAVILDIGGTTTDIAIFAGGAPLLETDGIVIGRHPTLVRAIITRSIGVGGDSCIWSQAGRLGVGPQRRGPAMAFGGRHPTLIDACNFLGISRVGDHQTSLAGLRQLAAELQLKPEMVARAALESAIGQITVATGELIAELNNRPVYTVHEMLAPEIIQPQHLYLMGGPAQVLAPALGEAFNLPTTVPPEFAVANAIGAALTRTTMEIELFADTEKKQFFIPNLEISKKIPFQYSLEEAISDGKQHLAAYLRQLDIEVAEEEITVIEADSFNMINNYFKVGKNIRVNCQLRPGIREQYSQGLRNP
ncbi:MAG: hydantoinase/oxoprolinase family protein [Deltaproteobacteria bacterium]|nr:hydantoinase/oxoprolinase family protein [Deltaproteobacteria bacterium]